jgi:hypothetical protein
MKPVAWTDGKFCLSFAESDVCPIPLYTAPRELSDDEIDKLEDEFLSINHEYGEDLYIIGLYDFVEAILNKASEK